ncbi:hypothetical protein CEXT_142821 [Caerostris extrusa]|uniref:Uncharacterized protein n=1 Tax=Caerostris extrusa TaxID=172846 RepID=A0AAV4UJU1_CAEEX|nr:hypothetical protein CEXT_142821 [Caerostris extrusa]
MRYFVLLWQQENNSNLRPGFQAAFNFVELFRTLNFQRRPFWRVILMRQRPLWDPVKIVWFGGSSRGRAGGQLSISQSGRLGADISRG